MRNWGVIVTAFYIIVVFCLAPALFPFVYPEDGTPLSEIYQKWGVWLTVAILTAGALTLFFVHADTSKRKLRPQRHRLYSALTIAFFMGLLTLLCAATIAVAIRGDDAMDPFTLFAILPFVSAWLFWSLIFFIFSKQFTDRASRIYGWLIKGSIIELLIAVPSHIIVRQREDCCAPAVTSIGLATGVAIMFMSFGPGVFFLYRERMRRLKQAKAGA